MLRMFMTSSVTESIVERRMAALSVLLLGAIGMLVALVPDVGAQSNTIVRVEVLRGTNALGTVDVELFDAEKPQTVRNFLLYIRSGAYSNSFIHRNVPGFAAQGGGFTVNDPLATNLFSAYNSISTFGNLTNEFGVGTRLTNLFGTIAMAKLGGDPDSATSQWFFNLANNSTNLDNQNGGFTVFGRVLETTNATDGTNVLAHFNSLSTNSTIANLGSLISSAYSVFSDLPVAVSNRPPRTPTYDQLYYTRFTILNDTYSAGTNAPTIELTSPANDARFTNQLVTIVGTAADDGEIARVVYRFNGGAERIANGTTNWSVPLVPNVGLNTITVQAVDFEGRRSTNSPTITFYYATNTPLILQVIGEGKVTGVTNGQRVELGRYYTAVAAAKKGKIFDGWTGSVASASSSLTFLVPTNATNFALTARFVTHPFIRLAGRYEGLIRPSGLTNAYGYTNAPLENSGHTTLSLNSRGGISGRIRHRNGSYSFSARLDTNFSVTLQGSIGGINRSVSLKLDTTNTAGVISGSVFGNTTGEIILERLADRLSSTNVPASGNFTFALANTTNSVPTNSPAELTPGGFGYGTAKLKANGQLQLAGTLGNGTAFKINARHTRQGRWPVHHVLARGQGVFIGWLAATTNQSENFDGPMIWVTQPDARTTNYISGFTNQPVLLASPFVAPASGTRLLNWVNGQARLTGANLVRGVTNVIKLSTNNALTILDSNVTALNLTLDLRSGEVRGSFVHPWIGTTNTLRGVVLKRAEGIRGLFHDGQQTGGLQVNISPFLLTQNVASVTLAGLAEAMKEGGILRFATNGTITLTNTLVPVYDTAFDANGHQVTIDGAGVHRLVEVRTNLSFAATGVTFANGRVDGTNGTAGTSTTAPQPGGDGCGAGLWNRGGVVALTNCVLTNFIVQGGSPGALTSTNYSPSAAGRGLGAAICNLGGRVTLEACRLLGNSALGYPTLANINAGVGVTNSGAALGGAVYSEGGECEFRSTTFDDNYAQGGESLLASSGSASRTGESRGGAIAVTAGRLLIVGSTLTNNLAFTFVSPTNSPGASGAGGGAVYLASNVVTTIEQTVLTANQSQGDDDDTPLGWGGTSHGGAIYNAGTLRVSESTLTGNGALGGDGLLGADAFGGALSSFGSAIVIASTFDNNIAKGGDGLGSLDGGTNGVAGGTGSGGAIHAAGGTFAMTNSTLALNIVQGGAGDNASTNSGLRGDARGGALALVSNLTTLVHVTIAYNTNELSTVGNTNSGSRAGGGIWSIGNAYSIRASIVATNSPANLAGDVADLGYNLSSDNSLALPVTTSVTNVEPRIGILTTNGGPTRTIALGIGSPALDLVPTTALPAKDQRGIDRPAGIIGDSGAFESTLTQVPPTFVLQPVGTVVRAGSNYTFQAIATGPAPIGYFWMKNGVLVSGATSTTLALSNVQDADTANYVAVATNSFGSTTSVVAALTVDSRPLLLGEPADASVAPGSAASFAVTVNGPALRYFWSKDGSEISGATNAVLTISNVVLGTQGAYQVIATNFAGAVTSRVATLTFNSDALRIVFQPVSLTVTQATVASLSVQAAGLPPFSYQWFFGSLPLDGATNDVLTFSSVDFTNAGNYRVVVTNAYRSVVSDTATLTIVAPAAGPRLTIVDGGETVSLVCHGPVGRSLRLQSSPALGTNAVWTTISTGRVPEGGELRWVQPRTGEQQIYFRVEADE